MKFWNVARTRHIFQAHKGGEFAKDLIKKQLRKNQLANLKRKTNAALIAADCYAEHERIKKPFDATPRVSSHSVRTVKT